MDEMCKIDFVFTLWSQRKYERIMDEAMIMCFQFFKFFKERPRPSFTPRVVAIANGRQ